MDDVLGVQVGEGSSNLLQGGGREWGERELQNVQGPVWQGGRWWSREAAAQIRPPHTQCSDGICAAPVLWIPPPSASPVARQPA